MTSLFCLLLIIINTLIHEENCKKHGAIHAAKEHAKIINKIETQIQ